MHPDPPLFRTARRADANFAIDRAAIARFHCFRYGLSNACDIVWMDALPKGVELRGLAAYAPKLAGTVIPPHLLADRIVIKDPKRRCFPRKLQAGLALAQILLRLSARGDVDER